VVLVGLGALFFPCPGVAAGTAVLELRSRIVENLDVLRTAMTPNPAAATDG
jgi:hypothetical protein